MCDEEIQIQLICNSTLFCILLDIFLIDRFESRTAIHTYKFRPCCFTCRIKGGPNQAITTPEHTQLITPLTSSTYCARKKETYAHPTVTAT